MALAQGLEGSDALRGIGVLGLCVVRRSGRCPPAWPRSLAFPDSAMADRMEAGGAHGDGDGSVARTVLPPPVSGVPR